MSHAEQTHQAVSTGAVVGTTLFSIGTSFAQSMTAGGVATFVAGVGAAVLYYYQKLLPAQIHTKQLQDQAELDIGIAREQARVNQERADLEVRQAREMAELALEQAKEAAHRASASGRIDELLISLAEAKDRYEAERDVAHAAERRADQLDKMLADMKAESVKTNDQLEKLRVSSHEANGRLEAVDKRGLLAVREIHQIFEGVNANGVLTKDAQAAILDAVEQLIRVGKDAADKADQAASQVVAKVAEMVNPTGSNAGDS